MGRRVGQQNSQSMTDFSFSKNLTVFTAEKYPRKDLIIEEMQRIFCRIHFFLVKKKKLSCLFHIAFFRLY